MDRRLIDLIAEVAAEAPASMAAVDRLESRLLAYDDVPGADAFLEAVGSYRPGAGEPGLLDESQLEFEARQFLHELGHHGTCAHEHRSADELPGGQADR